MKKKLVISLMIIFVIIVVIFCYFSFFKQSDEQKEIVLNSLTGTIYNITDNDIVLKDINNVEYNINLDGIDSGSIYLGDSVSIEYEGELSDKNDENIKIHNIKVIDTEDRVPIDWNDNGIFSHYYVDAYKKLKEMSIDEKIGQMFLVRVPEVNQIEDISKFNLGGYILFGRDTQNETKESLKTKIQSYQENSKIPMIIAVDEEGGTVVRVSSNPNLRSEKFSSPQQLYQSGGYDKIESTTLEMSQLLSSLGFNVNLAQVADVSTDSNDFIYERSFGKDASETSTFIQTVIKASKQNNVSYVLKHFPGYGNNKDTHTGISIDERSLEQFKSVDFLPFQAGIDEGAEAILVSHNIISQVEENTPASLSLNIHNILRNDLKFTGIVMTDDLDMGAIKYYIDDSPAVKAVLAGNDMLILTDYEQAYNDIKNAINEGKITQESIDHSAFRIIAWKYYKGLL